jgi:hypothetical protein
MNIYKANLKRILNFDLLSKTIFADYYNVIRNES